MIPNPEKPLKFENPIKKAGWIYRRSDNLHMWRKRYYELDNNIFRLGEDESFKDVRVINLAEYDVKWLNKLDKRFAICFTAKTKNVKGQYNIGDENEAVMKELYEKVMLALAELQKLKGSNCKGQDQLQSPTPTKSQTKNQGKRLSKIERLFVATADQVFATPEDVPSWVQDVCYENRLDKEDELAKTTEDWKLLEEKENVKILQNNKNANAFKLFVTYPTLKPTDLLQLVLDLDARPKWDDTVESNKYISDLPLSSLTSVIHRIYKPYGQISVARETFVSRVVFNTVGKFYILEKSLDDSEEIQRTSAPLTPVKINHAAMKIGAYSEQGSSLTLLLSQENCPDSTPEANLKLILHTLHQFANLGSVDLEQTISPEFRVDFGEYLEKFQSKSSDEETKNDDEDEDDDDEKLIDETAIVKESSSSKISNSSKELLQRVDDITSGKITRECVDPTVPQPVLPPELREKKVEDRSGHWLFGTDFRRDPTVGLEVLNREWIENQQKVISQILKSIGRNILEGKSIMSMSLPVNIFSKDTILQRAAKGITYAPIFVQKAAETSDPLEQFKLAVTFYFSILHLGCEQEKPFNPIVGETYQGYIAGTPVVVEQISHHPPISYLMYKTDKYTIHGTSNIEASMGGNSLTATQKGRFNIIFPDGNELSSIFPQATVCNTVVGKRGFFWSKKFRIFDKKNGFYCEIHIYPDEKGLIGGLFSRKKEVDCTTARGKIWRVKKEYTAHLWDKHAKKEIAFDEKSHAVETLATLEGSWLEYLDIDNKRYWSMKDQRPYELIDQLKKVLPSDSTCRQDLLYRIMGDDASSQSWKEKLENLQRDDRKLRQKYAKKK